jgi:hypothetical protein
VAVALAVVALAVVALAVVALAVVALVVLVLLVVALVAVLMLVLLEQSLAGPLVKTQAVVVLRATNLALANLSKIWTRL